MDQLIEALKLADGPWPVMAIAIIGLYLILWRYGGHFITLLRETHANALSITTAIKTNHGSESIGDAIDRLTEKVDSIDDRLRILENRN